MLVKVSIPFLYNFQSGGLKNNKINKKILNILIISSKVKLMLHLYTQ